MADLQQYVHDLENWEEEIKRKEASLNSTDLNTGNIPPIRSKKFKKSLNESELKEQSRIKSNDYEGWDKFDADAACEKLDNSNVIDDKERQRKVDLAISEKEKGNCYVKEQKWEEAIKAYTNAIGSNDCDPIFYANRALCYLKMKMYKNVVADCEQALRLEPAYVKSLQRRAAAYCALNKLQDAHTDLKRVLELEPKNKESLAELVKLEKQLQNSKKNTKSTGNTQINGTLRSSNANNKQVDQVNQKNCLTRNGKTGTFQDSEEIVLIQPVDIPADAQSKKPLKRIDIQEITSTNTINTTEITQKINLANIPPAKCKNLEVSDVDIANVPYTEPKTCLQFQSSWKLLKHDLRKRYDYLMTLPPNCLPDIFQEFLEGDVFSEILIVLNEFCTKDNVSSIFEYLKSFTNVKRFSTIIVFMGKSDKRCIMNILSTMEETQKFSQEDVHFVKKSFEL